MRLTLPLKAEYFHAIRDGSKKEEYRMVNDFWKKRIEGRLYEDIELTLGYPAHDNSERRLVLPWKGYTVKTLTHPHFGDEPVTVYAIDVSQP